MASSTTLTVRLKPETKARLAKLSVSTRRARSWLAAEAVEAYVARESEIVEGIKRGLADGKAGRVVPHDMAMAELDAAIARVARKKK